MWVSYILRQDGECRTCSFPLVTVLPSMRPTCFQGACSVPDLMNETVGHSATFADARLHKVTREQLDPPAEAAEGRPFDCHNKTAVQLTAREAYLVLALFGNQVLAVGFD